MNWRKIVLYSTTMIMEACYLYAFLAFLNKQIADDQLSVVGILLLYPLAFGFNKLIQRLAWHRDILSIISWLTWAILMLIIVKIQLFNDLAWANPDWLLSLPLAIPELTHTFRPELLILMSSGIIWWLGQSLAYTGATFTILVLKFQFSLIILVITFSIGSMLNVDLTDSIPVMLIFFFFALLGISIAHGQDNKSWLYGINKAQWIWLLLISIILVMILGMVIGSVISHDLLQLVLNALNWVGNLIIQFLAFIASLLPKPGPVEQLPPLMGLPPMEEPSEKLQLFMMPEWLRSWLTLAMNILWIGLILAALWQVTSQVFNWLRNRFSTADAEVESLRGAFKADLINFLKRILQKLLSFKLLSWLARKPSSFPPEVSSVHQIYRLLLRWGANSGYPRKIFQTPNEYFHILANLVPHMQQDLSFITQHYVSARYSTSIPDRKELHELNQSWDKIKQIRLKKPVNKIM